MVFNWLTKLIAASHPFYHMIKDCIALSRKPGTCKFHLIERTSNNSADLLAKKGHNLEDSCVMFNALLVGCDVI